MFYNTLYDAFLVSRAGIPALNRWNRIYWPVVWWLFACAFYYLIALAIIEASQDELDKNLLRMAVSSTPWHLALKTQRV